MNKSEQVAQQEIKFLDHLTLELDKAPVKVDDDLIDTSHKESKFIENLRMEIIGKSLNLKMAYPKHTTKELTSFQQAIQSANFGIKNLKYNKKKSVDWIMYGTCFKLCHISDVLTSHHDKYTNLIKKAIKHFFSHYTIREGQRVSRPLTRYQALSLVNEVKRILINGKKELTNK